MENKVTRKTLIGVGLLDGIIVSIINFLGFIIVSTQSMPVNEDEAFLYWINYINNNALVINMISVCSFAIPIIMLVYYIAKTKEEDIPSRIINMPLAFSLIGSVGWMITLVIEIAMLVYIRLKNDYNMHSVAMSSFLNIVQCCIFISTLVFMCLYTLHRAYILPKYFKAGNLTKYKGSFKISTSLIITFFYLSVCIFPVFYLTSVVRNYGLKMDFVIDNSIYYMVAGIICVSIIILCTVNGYFTTPLRKLNKATEAIKNEKLDTTIDVVGCDDFGDLADNFNSMSKSLLEKNSKIAAIQDSIIKGMAVMVESRDNSTGGHINRTSECVRVFINKLKDDERFDISDEFAKAVIKAAPMHDLGKIAVDDAILRKPGKFTDEEFEKMKEHAANGARIVNEVLKESDDEDFKRIAINVAHFHHEKWNGSGYPTKISGLDIPLEARIMALADVFDALVSKRCYKESMSFDKAFSIIDESLGQHFDPELGKFFISCRRDLEDLYMNLPE